jgi:hypothetical protein
MVIRTVVKDKKLEVYVFNTFILFGISFSLMFGALASYYFFTTEKLSPAWFIHLVVIGIHLYFIKDYYDKRWLKVDEIKLS